MKKTTRNIIIIVAAVVAAIGIVLAIVLPIVLRHPTGLLYTVVFDSNGGSTVESITGVEYNSLIAEPDAPTKEGHTFDGWFSDAKLTKQWAFDVDKVKGDLTLYAKWEYNATNGLNLVLNKTSYTVVGLGDVKDPSDIVIPDVYKNLPVTTIAAKAFENVQSITSVFIPDSVTSVNESAFNNCTNLQKVTLPDNLKEIKAKTFRSCINLAEINVPSSVTVIGEEAFFECKKLATVKFPTGLTSIGSKAFSMCESLKEIKLPSSLRYLGENEPNKYENVFTGCIGLEKLEIVSNNNTPFYSENNCLISVTLGENGQTVHTVVTGCKTSRIPASVTVIGASAFTGCKTLESITIPSGVTTIEHDAFANCESLTHISIPSNVVTIGDYAFTGCSGLNTISFGTSDNPSKLQSIGREAFSNINNPTLLISIPESVTFIGAGAFYGLLANPRIEYQGTSDDFNAITKGTVDDGEKNIYTASIPVYCSNATLNIVGLA